MFCEEEIKDIPACDASDQLIGFEPICIGSRSDHIWSANNSSGYSCAAVRSDQQPADGITRWPWQKDSFSSDFQDWWADEDRGVASNYSFADLEEGIKPDLKGPDAVCTLKSEEPRPEPSNNHSSPEVSSTSDSTTAAPAQTASCFDGEDIPLNDVAASKEGKTTSGQNIAKYLKKQGTSVTKRWECGTCGREFHHHYTLMRHLPTHTDERNFHCYQCGKSFRQLSTLSQHRAIHSPDRPYTCEVCQKTFNRVSTLISHRKTHSGNKPYKCHVCPKGFYQKGNLRNHQFTHTNERPYRCDICNKGFNQQSNLVCHKNKVHFVENRTYTYMLPSYTAAIKADSTMNAPNTGQIIRNLESSNGQLSSIVGSVQTMEVGSTSFSQDPFQLAIGQWDWLREESSLEHDLSAGVAVNPIKTYNIGVAQATGQTPFALLKPEHGAPVLVKVVDTNLPVEKQVHAAGGLQSTYGSAVSTASGVGGALQIRVPMVATVVPQPQPGRQLLLPIEEPHASATSLSANSLMPGAGVVGGGGLAASAARSRDPITGYAAWVNSAFGHLQGAPRPCATSAAGFAAAHAPLPPTARPPLPPVARVPLPPTAHPPLSPIARAPLPPTARAPLPPVVNASLPLTARTPLPPTAPAPLLPVAGAPPSPPRRAPETPDADVFVLLGQFPVRAERSLS